MQEKVGFTIGKFAPFHKGHEYLIETGINEMDRFIVVVYETDKINISVEKRAEWIKKMYPSIEIKYAKNPPTKYGLDDESVEIQMKYLINIIGNEKVTHFYSSEEYGKAVAKYMHIKDRRVDQNRVHNPISATKIRKNLEENKEWIEDLVYQDINQS